jgi:exonuclease VII large subunit
MSNPDRRGLTSPPATPWDNAIRLRDILEGVRQVLRGAFSEAVWVFAEAHEIRRVEKGHVYLTLVDAQEDQVSTKAILWAGDGGQHLADREEERGEPLRKGEKIIILCSPEYHTRYGFQADRRRYSIC